ncbi:MAG: hypothetical protein ACLQJR_35745 [Stellaceae bacterium]
MSDYVAMIALGLGKTWKIAVLGKQMIIGVIIIAAIYVGLLLFQVFTEGPKPHGSLAPVRVLARVTSSTGTAYRRT